MKVVKRLSNTIKSYYDEESGRDIVYGYADEVSMLTNETVEEIQTNKRRKEAIARGPIKHFVNCYHEPIAALNDVLTVDELGAVMKLIPYIRMNTEGRLYYGPSQMTPQLASRAIGKSLRQTRTILATLTDLNVLYREKVGRSFVYGVNDCYHAMGTIKKGAQYTKVMQMKTRTDITKISTLAAGILYKMIPFFNYAHYYLTDNPNEPDVTKLRLISHRDFADMVKVNRNSVNAGMLELRRHGFIMSTDSFGVQLYRINPDIMSRRKDMYDEQTEAIRKDFEQHRLYMENGGEDIPLKELPF